MGWAQATIREPPRRVQGKRRLLTDPPGLWARVRYRQLEDEARDGPVDEALEVLVAGRARLADHAQLERLAGVVAERLLRDETARGRWLAERAWRICDPDGRVPTRRAGGELPARVVDGGTARLRRRLAAVLAADPEPEIVREAARLAHLELLHRRAMGVVADPRQADRLLRGLLPAETRERLGAGREDGLAVVDREAWRRVFALVLVELSRDDVPADGNGREVWLRAKVRGELVRAAEGRGRPTAGFPAGAEALLEATRARRGARRVRSRR